MQTKTRTYRGKLPKPTVRGDVRPEIAGKQFTVGNIRDTTQSQMDYRLNLLRDVFDRQAQMFQINHWSSALLPYAREFARNGVIKFRVPEADPEHVGTSYAAPQSHLSFQGLQLFELLRSLGFPVETEDNAKLDLGMKFLQSVIDTQIQAAISKAVGRIDGLNLAPTLTQQVSITPHGQDHRTFHEALNEYKKHIRKTGKKKDNGQLAGSPDNYLRWADKLKAVHDNFPLIRLDKQKLEELTAYWRNREYRYMLNGVEQPVSKHYAGHIMLCLWSFLEWLSDSSSWKWKMPDGARNIKRKITRLDSDRKKRQARRIQGTVYNPEQLAEIAARLNTFQKMFLGLSVNCAMQPAESGRVEIGDYFAIHPNTGKPGDFLIFDRPKTFEYGEWLLWPEVAELVKWGINRSKKLGCNRLLVTDKGKDWYNDESRQPANRMSKWWQATPTEASKHIGIVTRMNPREPKVPSIYNQNTTKNLPSFIRSARTEADLPRWSKEMADLVNARKIDDDGVWNGSITDRYGDRPYDALAGVLNDLQTEFRPFLDALKM